MLASCSCAVQLSKWFVAEFIDLNFINLLIGLVRQGSTSDGIYVTMKSLSPDVKPAAHSIATQTSQPLSAAAAFFIRSVNATLLTTLTDNRNNFYPHVIIIKT